MEQKIIEKIPNEKCPDGYKELACSGCGKIYYVPNDMNSFLCPDCAVKAGETIDDAQQKTFLNK